MTGVSNRKHGGSAASTRENTPSELAAPGHAGHRSPRSENEAASLEQISAATGQMTGWVKSRADGAREAQGLADNAATDFKEGCRAA